MHCSATHLWLGLLQRWTAAAARAAAAASACAQRSCHDHAQHLKVKKAAMGYLMQATSTDGAATSAAAAAATVRLHGRAVIAAFRHPAEPREAADGHAALVNERQRAPCPVAPTCARRSKQQHKAGCYRRLHASQRCVAVYRVQREIKRKNAEWTGRNRVPALMLPPRAFRRRARPLRERLSPCSQKAALRPAAPNSTARAVKKQAAVRGAWERGVRVPCSLLPLPPRRRPCAPLARSAQSCLSCDEAKRSDKLKR
mgnify:CR=1 FL=1